MAEALRLAAQRSMLPYVDPLTDRWFEGPNARYLDVDRIHFSTGGHRHVAELLDRELTKIGT